MDEGAQKQQMKRRVVTHINLPSKFPASFTLIAVIWYRMWPPESAIGKIIMGFVIGLLIAGWTIAFVNIATEQRVDIFKDKQRIMRLDTTIYPPEKVDIYEEILKRYKDKFEQ